MQYFLSKIQTVLNSETHLALVGVRDRGAAGTQLTGGYRESVYIILICEYVYKTPGRVSRHPTDTAINALVILPFMDLYFAPFGSFVFPAPLHLVFQALFFR